MKNYYKTFLSLVMTFSISLLLSAQDVPIQVNDTLYNLDYDIIPEICMPIGDTITATIDNTWELNNGVTYKTWMLHGDLQFVEGYSAASFPTIKIVSPYKGYGKGRITYKYKTTGCSSAVHFDVFKSFDIPDSTKIEGPECVVDSQVVVYSVSPLVTKNLNDQIGLDSYYWNILDNRPPFVDTVLYISGDGSSITFRVGEVTDNMLITAGIGQCNSQRLYKTLGNATPKPEFDSDTILVPYGTESFIIGLKNPKDNVEYTWSCDNPNFELNKNIGDTVIIQPKKDVAGIGGTAFNLTVSAEFKDITCNRTTATVHIGRMWGKVNITPSETCVSVGDSVDFTVIGEIPTQSNNICSWTYPSNWNGRIVNAQKIRVSPTNSALLVDTIWVRSANRSDTTKSIKAIVHVKPAQITGILSNSCLNVNQVQTFTIDTIGLLPHAKSFHWAIDTSVVYTGEGTTSITFVPTYGTRTISVTPIGEDECNGETFTKYLPFPAQKPDSILSVDTCLFVDDSHNVILDVRLSVQTPISGQKYHWSQLENWTITTEDENDSTIVTYHTTNASSNNYIISAWATNNSGCGNSELTNYTIKVDTIDYSIEFTDLGVWIPYLEGSYGFSLRKNGQVVSDSAIWFVDGVEKEKRPSITVDGMPQSVIAQINIHGCPISLQWPNQNANNTPKRTIKESTNKSLFKLFPNPTKNVVNIELSEVQTYSLYIIDSLGHIVSMETISEKNNVIDVSFLPIGNYYFVISNGRTHETHKILIQH